MNDKARPRPMPFEGVAFRPRGEGGDVAALSMPTGSGDGTELGTGFARRAGAPLEWTLACDEVRLVPEGALRVSTAEGAFDLGPRDAIRLPAGTEPTCETEEAHIFFAVHPASAVTA